MKVNREKLLESSIKATKNFSVSDWCRNFEITFQGEQGYSLFNIGYLITSPSQQTYFRNRLGRVTKRVVRVNLRPAVRRPLRSVREFPRRPAVFSSSESKPSSALKIKTLRICRSGRRQVLVRERSRRLVSATCPGQIHQIVPGPSDRSSSPLQSEHRRTCVVTVRLFKNECRFCHF